MIAPFAFSGSMNGGLFLGWLEHIYVPALKNPSKTILLLDDATHHPKDAIFDMAEEYGFKVIFFPPYSPDFNKPIENFWANVKRRLRLYMHKFETFWDALTRAFI